MVPQMDFDEEKRVFCDQESKSDGFYRMDDDEMQKEGLDQESSEKVEKMSKRGPSFMKFSGGKSNNKTNEASAPAIRVCDFCGREFSSGKALGGHRRFHLQALRRMGQSHEKVNHFHPSNNNLKIKPNSEEFDDDIKLSGNLRSFCCCVCKKDFPSKKSLFGHMRSHPEREWRGVNPPFNDNNDPLISSSVEQKVEELEDHNKNNNGSSSSAVEVVIDLSTSCASSWFKKDKRGRRSIGAAEAAQNLVFLSCHGNNFSPPPREPATIIPLKKRKKNIKDDSSSRKQHLKKEEEDMKTENGSEIDDEIWKLKAVTRKKEKKLLKKKGQEKSEELDEKEDLLIRTLKEEVRSPSYECSICHKSFPTFQALGGHRSRHNRDKNIISTKDNEEVGDEEEAAHKVCINETLSGTTALGGYNNYMRCLSTGLSEEEEASPIIEDRLLSVDENNSNQEELGEASQSGSKILDFDLNEPYVGEQRATNKTAFCES